MCKHTHTHTHTQYNYACALVYRIFTEQTNKLNLFLAKKSSRIYLQGNTAFFISYFVGIIILQISLNLLSTEQFFFSKNFLILGCMPVPSCVCWGSRLFYKTKNNNKKLKYRCTSLRVYEAISIRVRY